MDEEQPNRTEPAASRPPRRRLVLRFMVIALLACAALFTWYYFRGSWATAKPKYPASPSEGVTSQIVLNKQGQKEIQTAVVLPVSIETAWKILSNYKEWEKLFKTVRERAPTEQLDKNRHHVVSDVTTPLGVIQLDFIVTHETTTDGGYLAWWDAPTKDLPVNRGEIRITPQGPNQTLLVYTVCKQYRQYPQFAVYNMLLDHQRDLVETLGERIVEVSKQP
jgi:hypothetical protein